MLLSKGNEFVTKERLISSRWIYGFKDAQILTKSFYFGADGYVKSYKGVSEKSWNLEDGLLKFYDEHGKPSHIFHVMVLTNNRLLLVGPHVKDTNGHLHVYLQEFVPEKAALAEIEPEAATDEAASSGPEGVRLIIWDLDETFWRGTLSEEKITYIQDHVTLIDQLNSRGIVNAICSKNDAAHVERELRSSGLWDKFIFPEISFSPKGAMVKNIVKNAQLRSSTVLFIDDNVTNLNEATFYVPGLQIAEPSFIPDILSDPRFKGKPDPEQTRLARYKVLEEKLGEQKKSEGDNRNFLVNSDTKVSFHTDIEENFDRIHELVNRTNQLNFTKNRWPEDQAVALAEFKNLCNDHFGSNYGYIKVSDRYGKYGICGFYHVINSECLHFLFSCRTMNMGVEQFVWSKIGRPFIHVHGEVISDYDGESDWITGVNDVDRVVKEHSAKKLQICLRGACDLSVTSHFMRTRVDTIEEFNFSYQDFELFQLPRIIASYEEAQSPANQRLLKAMPGMPPGRYNSDFIFGKSDAYFLSFSQESFCGYYRSKTTGLVIPLLFKAVGNNDYTQAPYEFLLQRGVTNVTPEQWEFMQNEFEFIGLFDEQRFASDARKTLEIVTSHNKKTFLLGLNDVVMRDRGSGVYENLFSRVNQIALPIAEEFGVEIIDVRDFVKSEADLQQDGIFVGMHYGRHVYAKITEAVLERL